jgi:methylmalonyl-CoA mutase
VGVNKYRAQETAEIDVLDINNTAVREAQIKRINEVKAARDSKATQQALSALKDAAKSDSANLLAHAIECMRKRATVGEISDTIAEIYGRHTATTQTVSNIYINNYKESGVIDDIKRQIEEFTEEEGRRPRILVVKLGQDGHDRGAKVIATGFADLGFDVDIGPLFQTPEEAAKQAIENDVHVIGVSTQVAGHKTLVPQLVKALQAYGAYEIAVVVGGIIPTTDYTELKEAGAMAIFGPGTPIPECAAQVLQAIRSKQKAEGAK